MREMTSAEMAQVLGGSALGEPVTLDTVKAVIDKEDGNYSFDSVATWLIEMWQDALDAVTDWWVDDSEQPTDEQVDETPFLTEQDKAVIKSLIQLLEARAAGTTVAGKVFSTLDYMDLTITMIQTTIKGALGDIAHFRATGDHSLYSQGSLVDWSNSGIDWSQYDNGGSDLDVFQNYINSLNSGGG